MENHMTEQDIIIKLELTLEEVNVIMVSLGKQPFELVESVISVIRQQTYPQIDEQTASTITPYSALPE
jgi:hypothetical protein